MQCFEAAQLPSLASLREEIEYWTHQHIPSERNKENVNIADKDVSLDSQFDTLSVSELSSHEPPAKPPAVANRSPRKFQECVDETSPTTAPRRRSSLKTKLEQQSVQLGTASHPPRINHALNRTHATADESDNLYYPSKGKPLAVDSSSRKIITSKAIIRDPVVADALMKESEKTVKFEESACVLLKRKLLAQQQASIATPLVKEEEVPVAAHNLVVEESVRVPSPPEVAALKRRRKAGEESVTVPKRPPPRITTNGSTATSKI